MTDTANGPGANLQAWKDDFDALVARPWDSTTTKVVNTAHEPPTAYTVDVEALDCDCEYMSQRSSTPDVCKHVAKAVLVMPTYDDTADYHRRDLSVLVDRAASAVRRVENIRDVLQADQAAGAASAAAQTDSGDAGREDPAPDELLTRALEDAAIPSGDVDIWVDDQFGSLQFKADEMDQDDFDRFRGWCQDVDFVKWDRDNRRNFVKADDFGRL